MIWSDVLSRALYSPEEIPIGVLTSLLGAPLFIWIIYESLQTQWLVYIISIGDTMYQINQLSFSYEKKEVLKNISVTFPNNKITAIIGPNGCGNDLHY